MSLTNVAMLGILLGFVFLVVGFLMEGPQVESESNWNKGKKVHKKIKKVAVKAHSNGLHKKAA
jgi:hypothetical protein